MRSSRAITLTLLSASMMTACCCAWPGVMTRKRDMTWYDANHHQIPEQWRDNPDGTRDPVVTPYDSQGRPWVKDSEGWHPVDPPGHTSTYRRSGGLWPLFGSGYRSGSSSYSSGSSYHPSSSSSVSHGGFGSTASHTSGS